MKIDKIILSSDDNPDYLQFSEIVGKAWKKLIPEAKTVLLCISDKNIEAFDYIKSFHDEFVLMPNMAGVPSGNHAMASRLIYASSRTDDETVLLSDLDMLPLNRNFFVESVKNINDDKLVCLGGNAYGVPNKFPICYMVGKTNLFKSIMNRENNDYTGVLNSLIRKYSGINDVKNITKPYPQGCNSGRFDDECMFTDFYVNWENYKQNTVIINRTWVNSMATERIDRSNWAIDMDKLQSELIFDAHLPRPLYDNMDKIYPLTKFLDI